MRELISRERRLLLDAMQDDTAPYSWWAAYYSLSDLTRCNDPIGTLTGLSSVVEWRKWLMQEEGFGDESL